ncbi:hypothetical protein BJY01DRAFT_137271 [Aspergillus pseudoustus]|uniref:Uncharacterized protein n=1 Tax=Aspergillus pseudoustus TaxID=1810923 RepID=A0ABR4KYB6_9EURO
MIFSMAPTTRSTILSRSLALLAKAQTENDWDACDPLDLYDPCIDPMTLGTVSLTFEPLFPEPVDFTWGFALQNNYQYYPGAPDTKVAYWLEYNATQPPASEPHDTYMVMALGGVTGTPSGGHNGCDGPLGKECAEKFAGFLQEHIAGQANRTDEMLDDALFAFRDDEVADSIGCSESAFRYFYAVTHDELYDRILAREDGETLDIIPSGNESFPFSTYVHKRTPYKTLINQVAIPVIVRLPTQGDSWRNVENIQVEFGCARSAPVNQPDYSDEDSDEVVEEEDTDITEDSDNTEDTNHTDTEDTTESPTPSDQSNIEPSNNDSTSEEPTSEETDTVSTDGGNDATGIIWSTKLVSMAGVVAMAMVFL